jgi:transcriptional regulator with XRE-family HTH domain
MINGAQIRMARAALHWKVTDLAERAEVAWARLQLIEKSNGVPRLDPVVLGRIRSAFEEAGIIFIEGDDTAGAGVRLTVPAKD